MKCYRSTALCILFSLVLAYDISGHASSAQYIQKPTDKPTKLIKADIAAAIIIKKSIKKQNWQIAKKYILKIKNPHLQKALYWRLYLANNSRTNFFEIARLIKENPNWPSINRLRKRAEEAMQPRMNPELIINWFKDYPPLTTYGAIRLGEALLVLKKKKDAIQMLRKTWVERNFGAKQERQFYRKYRRFLTRQDHIDRLERLLWNGQYYPVRRMLHKVNKNYRALAFARITLRRYQGSVDQAISKVPKNLLNDQGLIFERFRWRRRKGRDKDAIKLLKTLPENLIHPERWWREKVVIVRRLLQVGHISEAYNIASKHRLDSGKSFVEAEWLSGWIALQFLNESNRALNHFKAVYRASRYPISRSRGAYWAGRASEILEDQMLTESWYKKAAKYSLTYYGQLAIIKLRSEETNFLHEENSIEREYNIKFKTHELVKVVNVLGKAKLFEYINPFIKKLNQLESSANWHNSIAVLSRKNGRSDLAVYTAKQAYRRGFTLIKEGYPVLDNIKHFKISTPLLLAIIRQESAFNIKAISRAGARGLMQIMPATARRIAKMNKIPYSKEKLTTDVEYNLKFGQIYLAGLLSQYERSHVLSLAAYNAGPARANRWIKRNGDPREINVDQIDWVEMIPFKETRNYVQRVIENFNVYQNFRIR